MVNLDVRETRKLFYDASINRCIKGDEYDTQKIVLELAKVRADTWNTPGSNSPAILYIFGIMSNSPCDAV